MLERAAFTKPIDIEITAATIGINSIDWYSSDFKSTRQQVIETMRSNHYDIVPIVPKSGVVSQYYTLASEGNVLKVHHINASDKIYYLTHIRDVVWMMANLSRKHFFLSNYRDKNDVVGLVSLSNLNSRDFSVYLFNLMSSVERGLAELVAMSEEDALRTLRIKSSNTEGSSKQFEEVIGRLRADREEGVDNHYREYLYFHHLVWLVMEDGGF